MSPTTTSSPSACAGQKPNTPLACNRLVTNDLVEERLRVVPELARGGLVEDLRELPLQLPRVEEELPVDVVAERGEIGLHLAPAR